MKTRKLVYTAIFVAIGVLLPQIFHMVAGKAGGTVFLPMHIPTLLAGLLAGPVSGLVTGALTPLLSAVLTGMPSFDRLPFMILELMTYGIVAGLLYRVYKKQLYVSLLAAMLAGRIVNLAAFFAAGTLLHMQGYSWVMAIQAVTAGLPGILIQLVLVPLLVVACQKVVKRIG